MALNPTHLRSGNLIYDDAEALMLVESIDIESALYADYNGVQLTEAVLTSLGLRKLNNSGWWDLPGSNMNIRFYKSDPKGDTTTTGIARPGMYSLASEVWAAKMEYAHTLQNYVFTVTGHELTAAI